MNKLLIKNIKQLIQVHDTKIEKVSGTQQGQLPYISDAWLAIEDGVIMDYGTMNDFPGISDWNNLEVIDAEGKLVLPSWCDPHTHIVYANSREEEFVDRIKGLSYQEVAQRGGGILNSAKKMQTASEEELLSGALGRIREVMKMGTGAIEIKSGYGLTTDSELKMLRVIKKLKNLSPIDIRATFLGAHAIPLEYKDNKKGYIELVVKEMLPKVADEKLADYCDVFCEEGYFNYEDTIEILEAALKYGIKPKIHAEQLSDHGGTKAGIATNAISVDHLEYLSKEDIRSLTESNVMPTLLPGAQWFLQLPHPPAREMIDSGLAVAVASDYNPGSCPSGNMNFMLSMLCVMYKLTPEEAVNAATINAAYAMELTSTHGSISRGKKANIFITKKMNSYSFIPYSFSNEVVDTVIIGGEIQKFD